MKAKFRSVFAICFSLVLFNIGSIASAQESIDPCIEYYKNGEAYGNVRCSVILNRLIDLGKNNEYPYPDIFNNTGGWLGWSAIWVEDEVGQSVFFVNKTKIDQIFFDGNSTIGDQMIEKLGL